MITYGDSPYPPLWESLRKASLGASDVRVHESQMRAARDQRDSAIYMCLAQGATHASVAEGTGMDRDTVVQLACDWATANGVPWPPVTPERWPQPCGGPA